MKIQVQLALHKKIASRNVLSILTQVQYYLSTESTFASFEEHF